MRLTWTTSPGGLLHGCGQGCRSWAAAECPEILSPATGSIAVAHAASKISSQVENVTWATCLTKCPRRGSCHVIEHNMELSTLLGLTINCPSGSEHHLSKDQEDGRICYRE